ncbi:ABC transporter permease [Lichenifustis flavocetrariae]|uniref:ABC transporter permease n=1 Tax=Lichenifustis flavocetrariae TaxID=2949735 RepID=A0AA41YZJ0_9HYPH|nr:ABC transporter permease [Lichenifustis flavocetrariae]MCW6511451.1 ABC transporter permease [Lichenifustis flavocetrariae]
MERLGRFCARAYLGLFFAYLFAPLFYMIAAAFNRSSVPTLSPWRGFTLHWFAVAWQDDRLWQALGTSFLVGCAVVVLSITLGLAGALLMSRLKARGRGLLYALLVAPVLMPGIVIGLSTAIFWDRAAQVSGFWGLAVLGQSSFISTYCMLIFMARLQRFDETLEEAALDLGASPRQVFWTVTLPYLRPALFSAVALAFIQSFENYNTTLFSIGIDETLPIYIAGKLRVGVTPAINAVACAMIAATLLAGLSFELARLYRRKRSRSRSRRIGHQAASS